jgi:hypothetical protein
MLREHCVLLPPLAKQLEIVGRVGGQLRVAVRAEMSADRKARAIASLPAACLQAAFSRRDYGRREPVLPVRVSTGCTSIDPH